jgi:hypothetical protein
VGKSSLVNTTFKEAAVRVQAFKLQADTEVTTAVTRQVTLGDDLDGFKVKIIDTCGLEEAEAGDSVSYGVGPDWLGFTLHTRAEPGPPLFCSGAPKDFRGYQGPINRRGYVCGPDGPVSC